MLVGVLALQGCVEPHIRRLISLGATPRKVRLASDLEGLERLIMPGGESTTMLRLLECAGLTGPLVEFSRHHPVWGVCAGAILLAKEVRNPTQKSLGVIDVRATRNHYGSQHDSFKSMISFSPLNSTMEVDFIRAPLLEPLSADVKVLATCEAQGHTQSVCMLQRKILVTAFHTELSETSWLHKYFLELE